MTGSFRDLLSDDRAHVLDGAMGTVLYSRGVFVNVCYDELNVKDPGLVQEVHEAYVRAGAEIIETNTFGANPVKLSSFGLDDETEEINRRAVRIARTAAAGRAHVLGAMGPLGIRIEPWGPTAREEAEQFFGRQATGLVEGGVDGLILETFSDLEEILAAVRAVRQVTDVPIVAQMTVGQDGETSYGTTVETIAATLSAADVDAVGLNCSVGPAAMLDAIERLADATTLPISALPNAGLPRAVGDRKIYLASPQYMAQYARRMIQAGARLIGGCCGTTPEHTAEIAGYVASMHPRISVSVHRVSQDGAPEGVTPTALRERSRWGRHLADGDPVVSVEISPPKGWQPDRMLRGCRALRDAGADAVGVLDSARAHGRMSTLHAASIVQREVGIETVVHYTCRDRNMLGMVSDLLGAAGTGLRNLLIVTGDPPVTGPYPDATAVFDIDSIGLTNVVHKLNHGLDPGGSAIGEPTKFVIGVALNQTAVDLDREMERFAWKVDAGAEFAVTQPVFDAAHLDAALQRTDAFGIPIVAALCPLTSLRAAEFLANEVPGVHVPPAVLDRMRVAQAKGADYAREEGLAIALELHGEIRDRVRGTHVTVPSGDLAIALQLVEGLVTSRAR